LYRIFLAIVILIFYGCNRGNEINPNGSDPKAEKVESSDKLFEFIAGEKSNIHFENNLIDDPLNDEHNVMSFYHYYNGGGVAVGDINNDGLIDVLFTGNIDSNRLYLNKGNFEFEDITNKAGININKYWSSGATMADVNGDGFLDIYICQSGPFNWPAEKKQNLLYVNNGNNTFTEAAKEYGLNDDNLGTQAAFFDYDKDGDLDCIVMNESIYVRIKLSKVFEELKDPKKLAEASSNLYRNDNGKFTKVTEQAGLLRYGFGLGLSTSDINNDGWPDIYIANDYSVPDFMYLNNGDGTFTDKIKEHTKHTSFFSMGMDVADINNDGHLDMGVVDMATADHYRGKTLMASMDVDAFNHYTNVLNYQHQYMFNALQLNDGQGNFKEIANLAGVAKTEWSWAALFFDADLDGYKDYFIANGFRRYSRDNDFMNMMNAERKKYNGTIPNERRKKIYAKIPELKLPNEFYHNNQQLGFTNNSKNWGLNQPSYSNGAAYADLDNDGDLDLLVNNIDEKAFVYKNLAVEQKKGNYLSIDLQVASNEIAYNTKVFLKYNDHIQVQELLPVRGFQSSIAATLSFGLGKNDVVDEVIIDWFNDGKQILKNVSANQLLTIKKDINYSGNIFESNPKPIFTKQDAAKMGVNFKHNENEYNDFGLEILLPYKQSTLGPKLAVGDVNNDGLDDFYVGGAKNQSGQLYVQQSNGSFKLNATQPWQNESSAEDGQAQFLDATGNGKLDLFVPSASGQIEGDGNELLDRLYINVGNGDFKRVNALPLEGFNTGGVATHDYDGDGDVDLFVGGGAIPGRYPHPSNTRLYNLEGTKYSNVAEIVLENNEQLGVVKAIEFANVLGDETKELITASEWGKIHVYQWQSGQYIDKTAETGLAESDGLWFSINICDIDNDGDNDIIAGNLGLNNKFGISAKKPLLLYADDFDKNGSNDIVIGKYYNGEYVPLRGRECSSQQMPFILDKFPTYDMFAKASIEDIFGKEALDNALKVTAKTASHTWFKNNNGKFEAVELPIATQVSPILAMAADDFDGNGNMDVLMAGNLYDTEVETPRYDAGTGALLTYSNNKIEALPWQQTGFYEDGNVRDIKILRSGNGINYVLVSNNNGTLSFYSYEVNSDLANNL